MGVVSHPVLFEELVEVVVAFLDLQSYSLCSRINTTWRKLCPPPREMFLSLDNARHDPSLRYLSQATRCALTIGRRDELQPSTQILEAIASNPEWMLARLTTPAGKTQPDLVPWRTFLLEAHLPYLARLSLGVPQLDMFVDDGDTKRVLTRVGPGLVVLDIGVLLCDADIFSAVNCCPRLTALSIPPRVNFCYIRWESRDPRFTQMSMPMMRSLTCHRLDMLMTLLSRAPNLVRLDTGQWFGVLPAGCNLLQLRFFRCDQAGSDAALVSLFQCAPQLEELEIESRANVDITLEGLQPPIMTMPRLQRVLLGAMTKVTLLGLQRLAAVAPHLSEVRLSHFSDRHVSAARDLFIRQKGLSPSRVQIDGTGREEEEGCVCQ